MNNIQADPKAIFLQALECNGPEEVADFLDQACSSDEPLRSRVDELLRAHAEAANFLGGENSVQATQDNPITERAGTVIGHYKLFEQIGEGGFGVVFMAEQMEPVKRKVALKLLKPGMDTKQIVARFEAERQALAVMDHPNIAKVLDAGETSSGRPYFVMELVKGLPITEFCDAKKLETRERLELFGQVCQAIQHAHQKGIIHRDIKPSNVIVSSHDGKPVVRVIDFGIAKAMSGQLTDKTMFTGFAQMIGTPLYMSPEQAGMSDLDVDTRSDIYSLGVLMYELLTGTTPFDKERLKNATFDEIRKIIREEDPPRPSARLSTIGKLATTVSQQRKSHPRRLRQLLRGELDWIVMKALEKDRKRRYETANSLAEDVERYLDDKPVQACPPSFWYQASKLVRRRKGSVIAGLVVLMLFAVVGVAVGWTVRDREHRRNELAGRVKLVLERVKKLKQEQEWDEARIENRQAQALLGEAEGFWDLKDRIHANEKELDFVIRLQKIRMNRNINATEGQWFRRATEEDKAYAGLFREFGIDIVKRPQAEAASQIKRHPDIVPIISIHLDNWATSRLLWRKDRPGANKLWRLSRALDSDRWRNNLREALIKGDAETLKKMAQSEASLEQSPSTLWLLGYHVYRSVDAKLGLRFLRWAQHRNPDDFMLSYYAGSTLIAAGKSRDALPYLGAAQALRPTMHAARVDLAVALNNAVSPDRAIERWQLILKENPREGFALGGMGYAYLKKKDYAAAITAFEKVLERNFVWSKVPWIRASIARCYQELGQAEKALKWFELALTPGGMRSDSASLQASVCFSCRSWVTKLVKENPASASAHYCLGVALAMPSVAWRSGKLPTLAECDRDRLGLGFSHLDRAVELRPVNAKYRRMLTTLRRRTFYLWEEAHKKDPASVKVRYQLAASYVVLRRWKEAIQHLRAAAKKESKNEQVNRLLAQLLVDCPDAALRNPKEGLALARKFVKEPEHQLLLGLAEFRNGNWETAEKVLTARGKVSWRDVVHWNVLTMATWKRGNVSKAFQHFQTTLIASGKDPVVRRFHGEIVEMIPAEKILAACDRQLKSVENPWIRLARGEALARLNRFKEAARDCARAIQLLNDNGHTGGKVYLLLALYPKAIDALARLRPRDQNLWNYVRMHHTSFHQWNQAAAVVKQLFLTTPKVRLLPDQLQQAAYASLLAGDEKGYKNLCRKMQNEHGDGKTFRKRFGLAVVHAVSGASPASSEQIIGWAKAAWSTAPELASNSWVVGLAHYRAGRFKEAVQYFEHANLNRGSPDCMTAFSLAMAHHRLGNREESRRWYDFALVLWQAQQPTPPWQPSQEINAVRLMYNAILAQQAKALIEPEEK